VPAELRFGVVVLSGVREMRFFTDQTVNVDADIIRLDYNFDSGYFLLESLFR